MKNHIVAFILACQLLFTPFPDVLKTDRTAQAQDTCTIIVEFLHTYWEWCQTIAEEVSKGVSNFCRSGHRGANFPYR